MLLHIDTDIGGDTDDLCALAMVLGWPDAEVVAVTTVAEEAGRRAGYARYALDLAGRSAVPVFAGADVALGVYRERPTYPDDARYWPQPIERRPAAHELALDALARSIEARATVVAIGPLTNLALLERRSPGILRSADLVLMGGSVLPIRLGYPAWGNEWDYNIQVDVESARTVLEASRPTLVPLTVTLETALREADLPAPSRWPAGAPPRASGRGVRGRRAHGRAPRAHTRQPPGRPRQLPARRPRVRRRARLGRRRGA